MKKEKELLRRFIAEKNLKLTKQRETILKTFLSIEKHISAYELYRIVVREDPRIGIATVYRTMSLLKECGLAQELYFGDGRTRYEHIVDHIHHDHLICRECGKIIEFTNPMIEKLQNRISREKKFQILSHKLELYGICKDCRKLP